MRREVFLRELRMKRYMSEHLAIEASGISKGFASYARSADRLKRGILGVVSRLSPYAAARRAAHRRANALSSVFWALQDVSFAVTSGETVGIVGRNGSGKSTLLQIVCGTLAPTSGSIEVKGRVAAFLELGSGFDVEYSGRENIYLNAQLYGLSRKQIDDRYDDIVGFADIGDFVDQPVKTYSSGMFVRLAFAAQANLKPEILIVDEALAVGDALFQKRCYDRIEKLTSNGTTLLFVSHDEESVRTLTQRAIFLSNGKIHSIGTSADVILDYRRNLHEQESLYLQQLTKNLSDKAAQHQKDEAVATKVDEKAADRFSFGNQDAEVLDVQVLN